MISKIFGSNNKGVKMIYRDSKGRFCKAPSIKGYKGFEQGLICRGKQYKVGEVFTEPEAIPCVSGIHFCKNPLYVLKFYHPVSNTGIPNEYAEVEVLEEPITDDNIKFCTTKLKVVRKLSLEELIQAGVDYAFKHNKDVEKGSGPYSVSSSFGGGVAVSNHGIQSTAAAAGIFSVVTNSSTSDFSTVTNNGWRSIASSNGKHNVTSNTGVCSLSNSNGNYSIVASTGHYSVAFSNGNYSIVASTGRYSAVGVYGKHSVAVNTGCEGKVKGALGCWIACAEWKNNTIVDFKSAYVDGKKIKADTWYRLKNGKFVEI